VGHDARLSSWLSLLAPVTLKFHIAAEVKHQTFSPISRQVIGLLVTNFSSKNAGRTSTGKMDTVQST